MTEYMLVFAAAVAVMIVALGPKGLVTKAVDKSLNMMFDSVEDMSREPCLGIDVVNGGWSGWTSWSACAGCVQTRTRGCTNPSPKCNGSPCSGPAAETQACTIVGGWATGACGACTGDCGDTDGSCTRLVTCPSGCCSGLKPPSTLECTKLAYPDAWSEMGFGACSPTCDEGISSQAVPCSGSCCDAMIKPDTRRACTDGCCVRSLYIGMDEGAPYSGPEDDTPVYADFGTAGNGQPFSVLCPPGYAGNPTYTCTATADSAGCTGDDSYDPRTDPDCHTIAWGGFSGECQPEICTPITADIGYGSYTLDYTFLSTLSGATASVNCAALTGGTSPVTWGHTAYLGQLASYYCWEGKWQDLNAPCIPNCPSEDYMSGVVSVTFPETVDDTQATVYCSDYNAGVNPLDKKYVGTLVRDCGILPLSDGQWGSVAGICNYKPCDATIYRDGGADVFCEFPASPHSPTPVTLDCATCNPLETRYTSSFRRTCTYGSWLDPAGSCVAKNCTAPYSPTTPSGVTVTFSPTETHGNTQTVDCEDFNNNYTGNPQPSSKCCFGMWVNPDTYSDCAAVGVGTPNSYSGDCRAFACQTTYVTPPVNNASSCGDDTSLQADENWSVENDCTAKTCEWACDSTFKKSGNACVDTECTGSGFGNASTCGSQKPLVDTARWLNSSCSSSSLCEYYCSSANYIYYDPPPPGPGGGGAYCCYDVCTSGTCGTQTVCGQSKDCGSCCGNGAIDSGAGEVCDTNGSTNPSLHVFDPSKDTCAEVDSKYTGGTGTLGCGSDCTSFDVSKCCTPDDGTWGGSWVDVGVCGDYLTCKQRQQQQECVGESCGGTCTGAYPEQDVACSGACCGDGTCQSSEDCSTCSGDCGACCVPETCTDLGLCNGSTPTNDGCDGTISCGAAMSLRWKELGRLCAGKYCGYGFGNGTCGSGAYQFPWVDRYDPYSPHGNSCTGEGSTCGRALYARYPDNDQETYTFQCVKTCDTSSWKDGEK